MLGDLIPSVAHSRTIAGGSSAGTGDTGDAEDAGDA